MEQVKIGIIGIGGMGTAHATYLLNNEVPHGRLTAVCDVFPAQIDKARGLLGDRIRYFHSPEALIESGEADGVIIATPHYDHAPLSVKALEHGLHVLCEKPVGVYTGQVQELNKAAAKSGKVFGVMYNKRTNPLYQKVRDLLRSGELGELRRTNWIVTNWYRSQRYYNAHGWRATWAKEGGGVLINQAPHQLDLWQWMCGMPVKIRAFCEFGKFHDIEVEDDVTAYVQYENGATGVFVTTTADFPGTNRFEVTGDRGKIVIEHGKLEFWQLRTSERQFNRESVHNTVKEPECWKCEIPVKGAETGHKGITSDWVSSILDGTPLLAPGVEGICAVQLINGMLLSTWVNDVVDVPIDDELYFEKLNEKIRQNGGCHDG